MLETISLILILQIWGGIFYLLNKIFFSKMERSLQTEDKKKWRIRSWIVYIIGLPGWAALFIIEHNWIAFSIEVGGLPAMILGLVIARRDKGQVPNWLNSIALSFIAIGIGFSLYDFGGITQLSQFLELGLTAGFLIGTYLLARKNPKGYLCFIPMNLFCAALMYVQGYNWLMAQQIISLVFVIDAYRINKRN